MNNELFFEEKKYISAKRASELSGYNSDYIGQLSRSGKIDAKRVGRVWFIEEKSILEHKKNASEKVRGVIAFPPTVSGYLDPISSNALKNSSLSEISFSSIFDPKIKQTLFYVAIVPLVSAIFFLVSISYNKGFQQNLAMFSERIISFQQNLVANTALQVDEYVTLVDQSSNTSSVNKTTYVVGKIFSSIAKGFNNLALGTYRTIYALFNVDRLNTFVVRDTEHLDSVNTKKVDQNRIGIVTSPSTGNATADERLKQRIKDSFSDETQVYPDDSGVSGVIKPVFKKSSDQDYLYVVVPVGP